MNDSLAKHELDYDYGDDHLLAAGVFVNDEGVVA
jgi:hypothetical protein